MLQEEMEIQVMGGKEYSQTYLHMILSQYTLSQTVYHC